jgi:hypothetical protein
MAAEGDDLRYGLPLARDILRRLRGGGQPTGRELADAMCIAQWRLVAGEIAPYLLTGKVGGRAISEVVIAFEPAVGWARTVDRWYVLGDADPTSPPAASANDLMQAAAEWIDRQLEGESG